MAWPQTTKPEILSNPTNVASDNPTEKYRGAVGIPVFARGLSGPDVFMGGKGVLPQATSGASFGASGGIVPDASPDVTFDPALGPSVANSDVTFGARGTPVNVN
jgi:hypothetical protein